MQQSPATNMGNKEWMKLNKQSVAKHGAILNPKWKIKVYIMKDSTQTYKKLLTAKNLQALRRKR